MTFWELVVDFCPKPMAQGSGVAEPPDGHWAIIAAVAALMIILVPFAVMLAVMGVAYFQGRYGLGEMDLECSLCGCGKAVLRRDRTLTVIAVFAGFATGGLAWLAWLFLPRHPHCLDCEQRLSGGRPWPDSKKSSP
ncbi:MAG: hypothetical protein F4X68_04525 [Acidimicrobiia bacterium]|nr:hypothetical protein [Acidimicrobiia bacterium]MYB11029.1 hypothetical protein [Acidimicrobiia bacterium]MYB73213.1 hypothetical protein [Acidimicrobiia bacterium]MYG57666.1 hypothetical protein [Acidimicrobiia bacterium]MYJ31328.1 hypothetical protein [Acidimicrobiia bacterium]